MLLRLAYLGVTNIFALLRLLPVNAQEKNAEILALRHQVLVLQRQLGPARVRFNLADRALLADKTTLFTPPARCCCMRANHHATAKTPPRALARRTGLSPTGGVTPDRRADIGVTGKLAQDGRNGARCRGTTVSRDSFLGPARRLYLRGPA